MGHWYEPHTALPRHFIVGKNGPRDTTLRDARKHGWVPSVTEVLKVIAKPALENWKVDQGILSALTLPKADSEDECAYIARIKADSQRQAKEAAEEGTRIHGALEGYFRGRSTPEAYPLHIESVNGELQRLFPDANQWVPEKSFTHPLGFGGVCDLYHTNTNCRVLVDFKTKDGDFSGGKRLAYDQHWQLGAYSYGLFGCFVPCASIFISRTHPGKVASHLWTPEECEEGFRVFKAALELWKAIKDYDPAY